MSGEAKGIGGSDWSRREFAAAVGAAALASCTRKPDPSPDQDAKNQPTTTAALTDTVKIRFYGAYIIVPNGHSSEVYMVDTSSGSGRRHNPFLAWYKRHESEAYIDCRDLVGQDITLTGGRDGNYDGQNLVSLKRLLPDDAEMRKYAAGSAIYTTHLTLIGGSYSTYVDNEVYFDFTDGLTRNTPSDAHLAQYVLWDSGVDAVRISGLSTLSELNLRDHPAVVIGHLPTNMLPKEIYDSKETITIGKTDDDFKWLYKAFYPKGHENESDPWGAQPLAVPKVRRIVSGGHIKQDKTVGSPTCFGGCFGSHC